MVKTMFSKNKKINFLSHIALLLLILISVLIIINILRVKFNDKLSNNEQVNNLDMDLTNDENFNNETFEVYKSNLIKENIDAKNVKPNELGELIIVMYHGIDANIQDNNIYHRSTEGFRADLERIYNDNYYIISLNDYLNNNIKVPVGYTPIILTFDDGLSNSFSFEYNELNELTPTKDCAIYILNEYREKYNRPNATATFFINTRKPPFHGEGTEAERINYLVLNGYDLGNHGYNHSLMTSMGPYQIQKEVGLAQKYIEEIIPDYNVQAFSYPYGGTPSTKNLEYVLNGAFDDVNYNYDAAFLAASSNNTNNIYDLGFNTFLIPRIPGTNTVKYDLGWYFDYYNENPHLKFISDGNPDVITIQREYENKLNYDAVQNKNLIILD